MGRDYTTLHAASLLTQLPEGARVRLAYAPDAAWTSERSLLAAIVNDLNWLVWAQTKDAKHNRNFRLLFFVDEVSQFIGEHRDLRPETTRTRSAWSASR